METTIDGSGECSLRAANLKSSETLLLCEIESFILPGFSVIAKTSELEYDPC